MYNGNLYLIEKEARYRRQAAEQYARQRRLANLAKSRSRAWPQVWASLVEMVKTETHRVRQWLSRPSEPQEQGC